MYKILFCFLLLLTIQPLKGQTSKDSLHRKLDTAFNLIANNPSKAYSFAKKSLEISRKSNFAVEQINSLRIIGQILINRGKLKEADSVLTQALSFGKNKNLPVPTAHAQINYGNLELKKGSYKNALERYESAKIVFKSNDDKKGLIKATTNIGICHMYFSNYEAASIELHQALQLAQQSNDYIKYQGLIKNNLGRLQIKVKNYDKALKYLTESIDLLILDSNMVSIARGQSLIAKTLNLQNKPDQALKIALIADSTSSSLVDHQGIVNALIVIGEIYQNKNQFPSALMYFQKAIEHAEKFELYELLNQAQIQLGNHYLSNREFDKARKIINSAISLAAILNNDENYYNAKKLKESLFIETEQLDSAIIILKEIEKYVKNLEGNYDRIKLLESDNDLAKMKARQAELELSALKKSNAIFWLSTIIFIIILIGVFIFSIIRTKQKNALIQYEKNEEILKTRNLAIRKDKEIESIKAEIKGQELERRRLAKELHDGLGGTLSSVKLHLSHILSEQNTGVDLKPAIDRLDSACREVRTISHHLTPIAFDENLFIDAIEKFLDDLTNITELEMSYEIFPKDEIEKFSPTLKNDIYRIIQELVNNTIKHAEAKNLDLQLIMHKDSLSLIVEDDGQGFKNDSSVNGIGLQNINSRLELHGGNMLIDTQKGRGTVINIQIPLIQK